MAGEKLISENRRARAEYSIEETYEAGIVLTGTEVKSLREGRVSLKESYGDVERGEVWLVDCHISPYTHAGSHANHDPLRRRKLLLHGGEVRRLIGKVQERGYTLVPLRLYFTRGIAKLEIGLGKGKKLHDRRQELKKRVAERDVARELKERGRG